MIAQGAEFRSQECGKRNKHNCVTTAQVELPPRESFWRRGPGVGRVSEGTCGYWAQYGESRCSI